MANQANNIWTPEFEAKLRKLFAQGLSYSQIAAEIGQCVTRGAISGKCNKLGLRRREGRTKTIEEKAASFEAKRERDIRAKRDARAENRTLLGVGAQVQAINRGRKSLPVGSLASGVIQRVKARMTGDEAPDVPLRIVHDSDDVKPLHISIYELSAENCHWPYGDASPFTFCGCAALVGKPYCFAHDERSKPPAMQRKAYVGRAA